MRSQILRKFRLCAVLFASVFFACGESPTDVPDPQHILGIIDYGSNEEEGPRPLRCPTWVTETRTELITRVGGVVRVGGTSIRLPEGAVTYPTLITVTVPASRYMEVIITANDLVHFLFNQPVRVAIDYSRCPDWRIEQGPLSVWYWDRVTGTLIENMNGVDRPLRERMVFWTDHLSGYVIAN